MFFGGRKKSRVRNFIAVVFVQKLSTSKVVKSLTTEIKIKATCFLLHSFQVYHGLFSKALENSWDRWERPGFVCFQRRTAYHVAPSSGKGSVSTCWEFFRWLDLMGCLLCCEGILDLPTFQVCAELLQRSVVCSTLTFHIDSGKFMYGIIVKLACGK